MANSVPFVDLTRIHAPLKEEILRRISSIIDRSAFVLGPEVEAFEKEFAAYIGSPHSVGVNSGLDALKIALVALAIGPGDEVITQANTFIATAYAITAAGATPVLVDCDEKTYMMDLKALSKAITPKTKCILPVHLYGQATDMVSLMQIAKDRRVAVVEDCAQSHGAKFKGQTTGTFGEIGCFSFYPGKNLGSMGEGGAITTADPLLRSRVKMFRDVGQSQKYHHDVIGHNSRLHTMQATILSAKLPGLAAQNEDRAKTARKYGEMLKDVSAITLPEVAKDATHVYHLYVIATKKPEDRDALKAALTEKGIGVGIHYPIPIHLQACYKNLGYREGSFPVTERLAKSILSLPMFPLMRDDEVERVCQAIRGHFKC